MTAPQLPAAARHAASTASRLRDLGAARLAHWLMAGPAQLREGERAGAVAGWIGADGRADYVYPEITGYFLQWLAWTARRHGVGVLPVARADAALAWLTRWIEDEQPPTRIYVDGTRRDWRNDAVFTFDLAMVMRGIGAATRASLIAPSREIVDRLSSVLMRLVGADGRFDACLRVRNGEDFPARWSTRRGAFLAKAAAGILDAGEALAGVPPALVEAAQRTFDASLEALLQAPHDETHPLLYAIEGCLARPSDPMFAASRAGIVAQFDALLDRICAIGRVPEASSSDGAARLDIVAQTIRAGLLLEAHRDDRMSRRTELDSLANALAQYVGADGTLPFSPDASDLQFNVWTAMFAEQALTLACREPCEIARIAVAPSIV